MKIFPKWLHIEAARHAYMLIFLACIVGLPLSVTAQESSTGSVFRLGSWSDMTTLDITKSNSSQDMHAGEWVFCRLVWTDSTLSQAIPQVAESWDVSDDGLTYVFHLRHGVLFHNGRELKASDVVFSWDRVAEIADVGRGDENLADVASYEATGDYEFTVTLQRPSPIFLTGLSQWALAIIPQESVDTLETAPVGCGPYTFVEWIPGDHATYRKFADYWDKDMLARLPDEIRFIPVAEPQARLNLVQTGQVDVAEDIPAQNWESIQSDPNLHLIEQAFSSSYLIYIFQNETGPTSDVNVRRAISYAIDRDAVLQVALFGHGDINCAFIPRGHWAYTEFDCPTYDPDTARQLLADAGYADGLSLRIVTYEHPIYVPAAEVLQQNLADIGIDAQIDVVERAVWLDDAWRGGNFDITVAALTREPDPDGMMSSVFRQGGGNNSSRYYNAEVEDLFDQGKSTADPDARREIYAQLQAILLEDVPGAKVSSVYRASVANTAVEGLCTLPQGILGCWNTLSFTS